MTTIVYVMTHVSTCRWRYARPPLYLSTSPVPWSVYAVCEDEHTLYDLCVYIYICTNRVHSACEFYGGGDDQDDD